MLLYSMLAACCLLLFYWWSECPSLVQQSSTQAVCRSTAAGAVQSRGVACLLLHYSSPMLLSSMLSTDCLLRHLLYSRCPSLVHRSTTQRIAQPAARQPAAATLLHDTMMQLLAITQRSRAPAREQCIHYDYLSSSLRCIFIIRRRRGLLCVPLHSRDMSGRAVLVLVICISDGEIGQCAARWTRLTILVRAKCL